MVLVIYPLELVFYLVMAAIGVFLIGYAVGEYRATVKHQRED